MRYLTISALALAGAIFAMGAQAQSPPRGQPARAAVLPPPSPGQECRAAIVAAERAGNLPPQLMAAIARVESGRADGRGAVHPWPWTINAEGAGQYFATKAEALAAVRALQAKGVQSIDVGCMQVNLMHHPDAFASLEQAFDPAANAAYAARFLNVLYGQTRDWTRATAFYHSTTPERGESYQRKVAAAWPLEQGRRGWGTMTVHVFSRHAFSANVWNTGPAPATFRASAPRGTRVAGTPRTRM
jgi:hypothetical protein